MNPILNKVITLLVVLCGLCYTDGRTQNASDNKMRAELYEQAGDFESALTLYQQLFKNLPKDVDIIQGILRNLKRLKADKQLVAFLEQLTSRYPANERYLLEFADILCKIKEVTKAKELIRRYINAKSQNEERYRRCASLFTKHSYFNEAQQLYLEARTSLANQTLFIDELANIYIKKKDYFLAMAEYLHLFKTYSNNEYDQIVDRLALVTQNNNAFTAITDALHKHAKEAPAKGRFYISKLLADVNLLYAKHMDAFAILKKIDKSGYKEGVLLFEFAEWCVHEGLWELNLKVCNYIKGTYPQSLILPKVFFMQGQSLLHLEYYHEALALYDTLIAQYADNAVIAQVFFEMGNIHYLKLHDPKQALVFYTKIIEKYPRSSSVYKAFFRIGDCLVQQGKLKQALKHFEQLQRLVKSKKEKLHQVLFKKAEVYYLMSNVKEAKKMLKALVDNVDNLYHNDALDILFLLEKSDSPDELTSYIKAERLLKQGEVQQALDGLEKLRNNNPQSKLAENILLKIAACFIQMHNYAEAVSMYNQLITNFPETVYRIEAHLKIAELYENKLHDLERTISEYKKIIDRYPDEPQIPEIRNKLRNLLKLI